MNPEKDRESEKKVLKAQSGGKRLDKYMAGILDFSRSKIKREIKKGRVLVNNAPASPSRTLKKGDRIEYSIKPPHRDHIIAQDIPLDIIAQSEDYVIINKPPDLVVHPAPGNPDGTLLNGLMNRYETPYLVHRLDKDTSGVMIAALNENAARLIKKQFKKKKVKKIYLTLVEGIIKEDAGQIDVPIKRDSRDRTKMRAGWTGARKSATRFRVKRRLNNATYVEAYPLTGRTHQIRVHFSHMGHPVLGDRKYGSPPFGAHPKGTSYRAPRQMLHAWQVSFEDPSSGKRVSYKVVPPKDFQELLS
ncbi:MAG: RluA family pseudouridine synthase [Elusimicrobiota bacterium]|nr:RluA family pseudouridine synthase [Elusimicrobiota bacterium]